MYLKGNEGMIKQYSEAKTTKAVPAGVDGMYFKEFSALSDWQHHGEGLQLFNRMALSVPTDPKYLERVRRFAGFYMGEDPDAPNYDPKHNIIRSMMNGSKGPLLRKATSIEWVGEPFDMTGFDALHGERNFDEFIAHYQEYHDVVGDHALNLVATTLPANALLCDGRSEIQEVGHDLRRRMARADEAEQRHHSDLRRPGWQSGRANGQVVGKRVRMGFQPCQSCNESSRESQSH